MPMDVSRCPRPYCGGRLLRFDDGERCYLCGRDPMQVVATPAPVRGRLARPRLPRRVLRAEGE